MAKACAQKGVFAPVNVFWPEQSMALGEAAIKAAMEGNAANFFDLEGEEIDEEVDKEGKGGEAEEIERGND